ncbi:GTP cyclohydrolase FolE2 [Ignatzschineria sp. RMDPL8A]|uniref:GTP cyclohydrolase FolE2 n=1 Tax=Ignatzschineria sp. RMDPL8A TaxID=2999236 RepID=UPI00244668EA|nr:GTP cyclohydrolase FolE2 [Ignatzschineria sp. RMDPL8A]MDG9729989.1 GTP cyclohydrolase FolE2 [Ignatzschineria sp. RMDPL8A]
MNDVQAYQDLRNIEITKVGIKGLKLPLVFVNDTVKNHTVMEAELTVNLQAERKGTHMSRFIETWHNFTDEFSLARVDELLDQLIERLDAENAQCHMAFPLFYERISPVTNVASIMDFECEIRADKRRNLYELTLMAPVTSLCPCSKEISRFSAHSQRSHLKIKLRFKDAASIGAFSIDKMLHAMEDIGSSKLYPLLKREDEKYVTEHAYDNPKFVEDLVRDLVLILKEREDLASFTVESENFESIHNHQAYAEIVYSFE